MSERLLVGPELERLRRAQLTYADVGGTRGAMPSGYGQVVRSEPVGTGRARFDEVARLVLGWGMHRRAGLSVRPSREAVVEGAVAVLRLGWRFVGVDAPVRVVYVVDEPHRRGFAYGTLPGHPETGEEAFLVELGDDDRVTLTIRAFSRPSSLWVRAGGPIGRAVQARVTSRYLRAV